MTSPLLKATRKLENLERAWRVIQENGRTSQSETVRLELERFTEDAPQKLRSIKGKLGRGSFRFAPAKGVPVPKLDGKGNRTGKFRPIVLAPVESRIVQRAILEVLLEVPALKKYAQTPYSFGGVRGPKKRVGFRAEKSRLENVSAVPAAIKAILDEIEKGARYVACADIQAFFTKIPKEKVEKIVRSATGDDEFMDFFSKSIDVELSNLSELREKANDFPIEEIGVAQGNSLSPLLGNICLADFDSSMNEGDCRCIRYIDDFIIMAPTEKAANARLRKAEALLDGLGMKLSPEKSSKGGLSIDKGFDFLGIHIRPGLIRPGAKAQEKFLTSLDRAVDDARKAMVAVKNGQTLDRRQSLLGTLKRIDGMIDGWGKHYWFCNDLPVMRSLDVEITKKIKALLGVYGEIRAAIDERMKSKLLGISELADQKSEPFSYPSVASRR